MIGTIFHTREFWKNSGFEWNDIKDEGNAFHYNRGNDRKMDMYYDNIKYINIHNISLYQLKEVKIDGKKIDVPEDLLEIKVNMNPVEFKLKNL